MKNIFKVLALAVVLALSGCSRGWDKADMEGRVMQTFNEQIKKAGKAGSCTSVKLVADGENKFSGIAQFSDGGQKPVTVTIDPNTKEFLIQ